MLNQVADGVWVRQSEWVWSNAIVVRVNQLAAEGPEVAARLAADHAYIDALRRGEEPVDARLGQDRLSGPRQSNLEQARHSSG